MAVKKTTPPKKITPSRTKTVSTTPAKRASVQTHVAPVRPQPLSLPQPTPAPLRAQMPNMAAPQQSPGYIHNPPLDRPGLRGSVGEREQKALPPRPRGRASFSIWRYVFVTLAIASCVAGVVWYFFTEHLTAEEKKQAYVQSIATKVSQLVLTPAGEVPTIGVIPDPTSITENKEFFKNASQGDYLIVYPNARLMIIYNPAKNIVINMGYASAETPAATQ